VSECALNPRMRVATTPDASRRCVQLPVADWSRCTCGELLRKWDLTNDCSLAPHAGKSHFTCLICLQNSQLYGKLRIVNS
jgi:hypothetical protein